MAAAHDVNQSILDGWIGEDRDLFNGARENASPKDIKSVLF